MKEGLIKVNQVKTETRNCRKFSLFNSILYSNYFHISLVSRIIFIFFLENFPIFSLAWKLRKKNFPSLNFPCRLDTMNI